MGLRSQMASHTSAWHALHPRLPALTKSDVKNDSGSGPESGSVKFPMPAGTFESAGTRLAWLLPVGALLRAFRLLFLRPACRQAGKACRQGDERGHDEKFPLQPLAGTLGAAGGSCSAWFVMVVLHGFTPSSSLRSVLFRVFGGHLLPQAFGFRSTAVRTVCRARHVPVFNKSIELRFRAWKAINKLDDFGPRATSWPRRRARRKE